MEKDAKYFIVGIFVSLALVALVGFTLWVAGTHDTKNYERYTVYFTDPVSGLKEGASVQYKGVEVGKVTDIRLAPERKDLIKVDIMVDENTPIRAGTRATLAMLGVTGLVYMELTTELKDTQPVPYREDERYPVIQGSGTQLARLFQDIPEITQQILEITDRLNVFLNDENMAVMNDILANTERLTRDMNGFLSPENVAHATTTLENLSRSSGDLQAMIARFETTASGIDEAVNSINDIVTTNKANVNKFTGEGLDQITSMSREARKSAESIRKAADKLSQDPSRILYQPSQRGVEIAK